MRAVAACWVLVFHASNSVDAFIAPWAQDSALIANGYLGVDFFFVLSGFIIAYSSNRLLETGRGVGDYARAWLIRIYVPYLPIGVTMLVLYQLLPGVSEADRSTSMLTSLTLLPAANPPALSVAWTLVHEMVFYALFSLIFISRRLLWLVLAAWAGLIAYQFTSGQTVDSGWEYLLSPLNLCFLLGVLVFYATRRGVASPVALLGGAAGTILVTLEAGRDEPDRFLMAFAFAGFIVFAMSHWAQHWAPGKTMLFIGAASYSIYLIHHPALSVFVRLARHVLPGLAPATAFLLISSLALMAGLAYYYFYERHALAFARVGSLPPSYRRQLVSGEWRRPREKPTIVMDADPYGRILHRKPGGTFPDTDTRCAVGRMVQHRAVAKAHPRV